MATSKPSGTNCPKSSFRSTAHPSKREVRKQQHKLQAKSEKAKKTRSEEPNIRTRSLSFAACQKHKLKDKKDKRSKGQNDQKRSNQYQAKVPMARPRPLNLKPNGHQPSKSSPRANDNQAVIAAGSHLFPSRTEKLSPPAPMVLHTSVGE